jgi:beta-N-acetylhexosaminidase
MATTLGVDALLNDPSVLGEDRLGLVTNQTGVTADLRYNRQAMLDAGLDLQRLFSPEHGIWGVADAGEKVGDYTDDMTGLQGTSLYGDKKAPDGDELANLDTLVFDIQDIGVRCWTYTTTMKRCLEAAAEHDRRFVVLDRPNPLAGAPIEGAVMTAEWSSFVGIEGLPLLYGLTIGELAGYANEAFGIGADLEVVELEEWDRNSWYDETGLTWVPSIPQLSSLEKALVYPATVFLEGTNVTPGWGTSRGPKVVGAPWVDREATLALARENIDAAGLSGVGLRADRFRPRHGVIPKHVDEVCDGFQIHVTDRDAFDPLRTGLCVLSALHDANDEFSWRADDEGKHWTDVLGGTPAYRERISEGAPIEDVLAVVDRGVAEYTGRYDRYWRY